MPHKPMQLWLSEQVADPGPFPSLGVAGPVDKTSVLDAAPKGTKVDGFRTPRIKVSCDRTASLKLQQLTPDTQQGARPLDSHTHT